MVYFSIGEHPKPSKVVPKVHKRQWPRAKAGFTRLGTKVNGFDWKIKIKMVILGGDLAPKSPKKIKNDQNLFPNVPKCPELVAVR